MVVELHSYDLARIYFDTDVKCVVSYETALGQRFVRDKSWKSESKAVRLLAGSLEVLPCRIWDEALYYVACLDKKNLVRL